MNPIAASDIFSVKTPQDFERAAIEVFRFQAEHCKVYADFIKYLSINPVKVKELAQIPFLPIEFFKTREVISSNQPVEITFTSSGTSKTSASRHLVNSVNIYEQSYQKCFEKFYGDVRDYALLALLPSYQEREGSSLIYMVDDLIRKSGNKSSGYFLDNYAALADRLNALKEVGTHTLLIGVTYALLDFAESHSLELPQLIVMETGGMKGRRKEIIRPELHEKLCEGFGVPAIHSEYGMTELLSQAYSKGGGKFHAPAWMQVCIRDVNDPLQLLPQGFTGGINVIDLANLNSCAFIATQDLGKIHSDKSFDILGRFDHSDIRGCNLLVQ